MTATMDAPTAASKEFYPKTEVQGGRDFPAMNTMRKGIATAAIASLGLAFVPIASAAETNREAVRGSSCKLAKLSGRSVDTTNLHTTGEISIGDWNINVRSGNWAQRHPTNPVHTVAFHSGAWMVPEAKAEIAASVELLLAYSRALPDSQTNQTSDLGWKESMTTKRLLVAACLYKASGDHRLIKVIDDLAEANMDPDRYYGPPQVRSHNHGVMADRSLMEAAAVMNRPDWRATAISRLKKQLAGYFDQCGMTYEQASTYQVFNAGLWRAMAGRVLPHDPVFAAKISGAAAEAHDMARTLANPDGSYEGA